MKLSIHPLSNVAFLVVPVIHARALANKKTINKLVFYLSIHWREDFVYLKHQGQANDCYANMGDPSPHVKIKEEKKWWKLSNDRQSASFKDDEP